jgi:hypothetical protein
VHFYFKKSHNFIIKYVNRILIRLLYVNQESLNSDNDWNMEIEIDNIERHDQVEIVNEGSESEAEFPMDDNFHDENDFGNEKDISGSDEEAELPKDFPKSSFESRFSKVLFKIKQTIQNN